jgi:hypothetical protein
VSRGTILIENTSYSRDGAADTLVDFLYGHHPDIDEAAQTQDATQPLARVRRRSHRVVMPVVRTVMSGFARRLIVIALSTWIVTWSCIGILLYFRDTPPPPYVLDRDD